VVVYFIATEMKIIIVWRNNNCCKLFRNYQRQFICHTVLEIFHTLFRWRWSSRIIRGVESCIR